MNITMVDIKNLTALTNSESWDSNPASDGAVYRQPCQVIFSASGRNRTCSQLLQKPLNVLVGLL